ncbi:post-transcriptional regulator [Bacillus sp. S/N-304-OC-R1]|uniref:post-transcriptional regulator n=1 Tax=Bacillus sp. S/N-304-OC-R1 TaxID=2758034 RepID=UPI001C8EC1C0|nr:post-transcriptional regulator [Bacillus sp. S/N-304-OC-R1]MBY0123920.1 post-transcriptional regulator [Bacillus sp. S/N-304-OC-R1]
MEISHTYDHLRNELKPALKSKQEEFSLLGYDRVTEQELWDFLKRKKWRKADENRRISELVQDIFSVKVGEFFNYATVEAFKGADFAFSDEDELRKLLK